MTLDEAIKHAEEVAEENKRVVDKFIVFGDMKIDMHYCDDPEITEEYLANCQMCAKEHRQLAEWLKELKTLKQNVCVDAISRQAVLEPYKDLKDDDVISVWLIKKNIEQIRSLNIFEKIKSEMLNYSREHFENDENVWTYIGIIDRVERENK